jgi:hypothetical protein
VTVERGLRIRQAWLLLGGLTALMLAVALAFLAFNQFAPEPGPDATAQEVDSWNDQAPRDAFRNVALGIASAFSLLACFACFQAYQKNRGKT